MTRRSLYIVLTIALILSAARGLFLMMEQKKVIRLYIGEPLQQYFAETGDEAKPRHSDHQPYIWPKNNLSLERFQVILGKPGSEIIFPSVRLIWIQQYAAVIYAVTLNTSDQKLSLPQIYKELSELRTSFLQAGWKEDTPMQTYEQMANTIQSSQGTSNGFQSVSFKKNADEALLLLTTPGDVVSSNLLNKISFAVEVEIQDAALEDELSRKTYDLRKKINGDDSQLPLSYWLKQ